MTAHIRLIEIDVRGLEDQLTAAGHRIPCVDRQVHDHLLHLARIDFDRQKFGIQSRVNLDILADEPAEQRFGLAHDRVEIHQARLHDLLPAKRQELAGQLRGPLRGV